MHKCLGGCHCGRVKIEVQIPEKIIVHRCNCSICQKSGYLHLIVEAENFKLLSGEESLTDYSFHTGVARHLFCKYCGIKSFYIPRSHPRGFSVNLNCMELPAEIEVTVAEFDGRNWSENRKLLAESPADKSRPG